MARCACGNATCSCVVKAAPNSGITVVGNGSPTRPYQIGQVGGGNPLANLDVIDDPSLDLTISGAGTATDKRIITGKAHPAMRELRDVDASDVPANGDVVTWSTSLSKWVFSPPAAGSGVPPGGTTGQVLTKYSNLDGQANWQTPASGGGTVGPSEPYYASSRRQGAAVSTTSGVVTTIPWDTEDFTDGIPFSAGVFTIPATGYYQVNARATFDANATGPRNIRAVVAGSASTAGIFQGTPMAGSGTSVALSRLLKLTAGDTVTIQVSQTSGGTLTITANTGYNSVDIYKVPSPGGVPTAERPYASSRGHVTATSIPNGTWTPIPFDTNQYEDGIAWDAGGTRYLIPADGYYQIDAGGCLAQNTTGYRALAIYQNSTPKSAVQVQPNAAASTGMGTSVTLKCVAGDYITTRIWHSAGAALAMSGGANNNFMAITKVPATIPASNGIIGERIYASSRGQQSGYSLASSTSHTVMPMDVEVKTDGIAWDATQNGFIIPVSGWYRVTGGMQFGSAAAGYRLISFALNGAQFAVSSDVPGVANGGQTVVLTRERYFTAGDLVQLRAAQNSGAALAFASSPSYNFFDITKIPSVFPQSVAIGEKTYTIAYRQTTSQSFASGGNGDPVLWDALDYSEGGITYDGAGRFIVPVAGYYQVNAKVHWAANATGRRRIRIGLDGSSGVPGIMTEPSSGGASDGLVHGFSRVLKCNAGSQIIVGVDHTAGVALTVGPYTSVDITKVPAPAVAGSAASGVWGTAPLDKYGSDTLQGRPVYVDANGQLRAEPAGVWVDCKAEVRFCTDASTTANAGQSITSARYMKIGKTVWFSGYGVVGSGAVVNFALLLPPSAGVPYTATVQVGPPQAKIGGGDEIAGGWFLANGDRIINLIGASSAYSDSVANEQYRWSIVYEVL